MKAKFKKDRGGFTLVEMAVAMAMSLFVILAFGTLLTAGWKAWNRTYSKAHVEAKKQATDAAVRFCRITRMAESANVALDPNNPNMVTYYYWRPGRRQRYSAAVCPYRAEFRFEVGTNELFYTTWMVDTLGEKIDETERIHILAENVFDCAFYYAGMAGATQDPNLGAADRNAIGMNLVVMEPDESGDVHLTMDRNIFHTDPSSYSSERKYAIQIVRIATMRN